MVTHLHEVYGVVVPSNFETVRSRLELFNLNIFALPALKLQCYGFPTFASQVRLPHLRHVVVCCSLIDRQELPSCYYNSDADAD